MKIKIGLIFIALGTVLILGALSFFLHNQQEAAVAENSAAEMLPKILDQMQQQSADAMDSETDDVILPEVSVPEEDLPEETEPNEIQGEMPVVEIEGDFYVGVLSIPELGLELPVMADWSYPKLKRSPCRYTGTTMENNLVILAHNYERHFGKLKELELADAVDFVDMDGQVTHYQVTAMDVLSPTSVEEVTSGQGDLTLFTCTYGGKSRVVVYCDRMVG